MIRLPVKPYSEYTPSEKRLSQRLLRKFNVFSFGKLSFAIIDSFFRRVDRSKLPDEYKNDLYEWLHQNMPGYNFPIYAYTYYNNAFNKQIKEFLLIYENLQKDFAYVKNPLNEYVKYKLDPEHQLPLLFENDPTYDPYEINKKLYENDGQITYNVESQIGDQPITDTYTIQNYPISYEEPINGIFDVSYTLQISEDIRDRKTHIPYNNEYLEEKEIVKYITNYLKRVKYHDLNFDIDPPNAYIYINSLTYKPISMFKEFYQETIKYHMTEMVLREDKYLEIDYDNIFKFNLKEDDNCVIEFMKKTYGESKNKNNKISIKNIENFFKLNNTTPNSIIQFCKKYNIKAVLYDINLNVISENVLSKKSQKKSLVAIVYNNHIYPSNDKYLNKKIHKKYNMINVNESIELYNKFDELVKTNYIREIEFSDHFMINKFTCNNNIYFYNNEYNLSKKILSIFGLSDKCNEKIKVSNISNLLKKLYKCDVYNSFFPYKNTTPAFTYSNNIDTKDKEIYTIDKSFCYCYLLSKLKHIYVTDIRNPKYKFINYRDKNGNGIKRTNIDRDVLKSDFKINENYIYLCNPLDKNILMKCKNFYTGYYLLKIEKYNINYEIFEGLFCDLVENRYNILLNDLYRKTMSSINNEDLVNTSYKTPRDVFKHIYCTMIGKMDREPTIYNNHYSTKHCNKDEFERSVKGTYLKRNDIYYQIESHQSVSILYKELAYIQIKEECDLMLFDKMVQLKLLSSNILQINTDSISFICQKYIDINELHDKESIFGEWKYIELKRIKSNIYANKYNENLSFNNFDRTNENTYLFNSYAGTGKSFFIKNNIIKDNNNYIILSAKHNTLRDYRQNGLVTDVIHKYLYGNYLPSQQNIIIDEYGLLNNKMNELLYKLFLLGRSIYCFGDFNQKLPVSSNYHCNNELYLNLLFKNKNDLNYNFRNKFSIIDYCSIINNKDNKEDKQKHFNYLIKKHLDCKIDEADMCIAYRNITVRKINKYMINNLKLSNKNYIGANIVCRTNKLHNLGFQNQDKSKIIDAKIKNNKMIFILDDKNGTQIPAEYLNIKCEDKKYKFEFNYCETLDSSQGQQYKKIYACEDDYNFFLNNNRNMYTLISRLQEDIEINDKNILPDIYSKKIYTINDENINTKLVYNIAYNQMDNYQFDQ